MTSNGRLLLTEDSFQKKVENNEQSYSKDAELKSVADSIEKKIDYLICELLSFRYCENMGNFLKAINYHPRGTGNTITIRVNSSLIDSSESIDILLRYCKDIKKMKGDRYYVSMVMQIIGIGYQGNMSLATKCDEFETQLMVYNVQSGNLAHNISDVGSKFLNYIASQCEKQVLAKGISESAMKNAVKRLGVALKRKGIKTTLIGLVILSCTGILTGCSSYAKSGGVDNTTGSRCVFSSVDKAHYTADDMAVKVYVCTEDNDDGHKDFYVGEKEFEARFGSFEL